MIEFRKSIFPPSHCGFNTFFSVSAHSPLDYYIYPIVTSPSAFVSAQRDFLWSAHCSHHALNPSTGKGSDPLINQLGAGFDAHGLTYLQDLVLVLHGGTAPNTGLVTRDLLIQKAGGLIRRKINCIANATVLNGRRIFLGLCDCNSVKIEQ